MAETPSTIQPGTPLEDNLARINDNFKAIDDENRTKIIREGDTPRILFGYQKDGFGVGSDYGLKISQPGYDVTTATDTELVFNSNYNSFKILATGTISVSKAANDSFEVGSVDLSGVTGITDTPAILVFADYNNELLPSTYPITSGTYAGYVQLSFNYEVDSTITLFVEVSAPNYGAGSNVAYVNPLDTTFRYYVLVETSQ